MNPDLELAIELADAADEITLRHFRSPDLAVETKADMSPVTAADRAVEEALGEHLKVARPDHAVVGEELGARGEGPTRWIVDPIDGTKNYIRGIPVFATLIALEEAGRVTLGVASAPALRHRWYAAAGEGAFTDGDPIHVSAISRLEDAQVCHGSLDGWERIGRLGPLLELIRRCRRERGFGDFWQHMLVAQGSAEVALEADVSMWDLAAVKVIVEEAGGRFTDLSGASIPGGGSAISSNGLLHDQVLGLLAAPAVPPASG